MLKRNERGQFLPSTKVIDGEVHRLCKGPGHDEPTWLPETEKYFYRSKSGREKGKFYHRCRLCSNWEHLKSPGLSGMVPNKLVRPYFIEGVNRVGMMEFARRTGLSANTINWTINGRKKHVQKMTVRVVMMEIISMRRKNEVRHRDSIKHGSEIRGRTEKAVKSDRDLYQPLGDTSFRNRSPVR